MAAPRRCQDTATGPAMVGTDPDARASPPEGGTTDRRTVPSGPGSSSVTPSSVSCMATSADEPQPCDMESPIRSLGDQISQVKVPPAATMWAQPGTGRVGERAHHHVGPVRRGRGHGGARGRGSGRASMPRPAT